MAADAPFTTIMGSIESILYQLHDDPRREGLEKTPYRVAKMMLEEVFSGYLADVDSLFRTFEEPDYDQMIIVRDIYFYSHCEHHMVPFFGTVDIGYIPQGRVLGLSKFARLVDAYAKRLQIQERLTQQIADMLWQKLEPKGVMVVVRAEHLCMAMRGVSKPGSHTITSAVKGVFEDDSKPGPRSEFLALVASR